MGPELQLTPDQLAVVQAILGRIVPEREVRVFGSRARGQAKPYSDLDLAVMGDAPLSMNTLAMLTEAFAQSDLPWRVDVLDWASTSPEFRQHIAEHSRRLFF